MIRFLFLALCGLAVVPSVASAAGLPEDAVRSAIVEAARRNLPDTVLEIEARSVNVYGTVDVPTGVQPELRVLGRGDWLGRVRLELEVSASGKVLGTVPASVEIVGYIDVPVLRRSMGRGTRIGPQDLSSIARPLDSVPTGTISDMDGLMGRVVKRDLKLGATVRAGDLEKRIDARRGRPVTLRLNADSLRIQSTGVLQEDAGIGSWVVVETESGSELRGLLVAPDVVEVSIGPATGGLR